MVIEITDSSFTASNGKLDSTKRYIFETSSSDSLFNFPTDKTLDLPVAGVVYSVGVYKHVSGSSSTYTCPVLEVRV
jgi:hypothetical protein